MLPNGIRLESLLGCLLPLESLLGCLLARGDAAVASKGTAAFGDVDIPNRNGSEGRRAGAAMEEATGEDVDVPYDVDVPSTATCE